MAKNLQSWKSNVSTLSERSARTWYRSQLRTSRCAYDGILAVGRVYKLLSIPPRLAKYRSVYPCKWSCMCISVLYTSQDMKSPSVTVKTIVSHCIIILGIQKLLPISRLRYSSILELNSINKQPSMT